MSGADEREPDRQRRFELLLLDYEMAREDERVTLNVQAAMFSVGLVLVSLLVPVLVQTCRISPHRKDCVAVSDWLIVLAPMLPMATVGFLIALGIIATVRTYYMRAVESELQSYAGGDLRLVSLPPGSYMQVLTELTSTRRGRGGYRPTVYLIIVALAIVLGGLAGYIIAELSFWPKLAGSVFYTIVTMVFVAEAVRLFFGGRSLFAEAVASYLSHRVNFPDFLRLAAFRERSLVGYLVLPRPQDIIKWLFLPASFAVGLWVTTPWLYRTYGADIAELFALDPGTALAHVGHQLRRLTDLDTLRSSLASPTYGPLLRFAAVFIILEYLLYEARYQWNDIRGLDEDLAHPVPKGRLPVGYEGHRLRRNVIASQLVLAVRIAAAFAVAHLLGNGLTEITATVSVLVFGVAILYEWLRNRRVPAGREFATSPLTVAIWIVVGSGYAIRGGTGLVLAGLPVGGTVTVTAILFLIAFGTMFVALTWVLDASSYCDGDPSSLAVNYSAALRGKPHLAALLPYLGATLRMPLQGRQQDLAGKDAKPLRRRGRLHTPWNLAAVCAGGLAAALGVALALTSARAGGPHIFGVRVDADDGAGLTLVAAGGLIGGLATCLPVRASGTATRWLWVSAVIAAVTAVAWSTPPTTKVLLLLPWVLSTGWYCWFRSQSFTSLKAGLRPALDAVATLFGRLQVLITGRRTAELVSLSSARRTPPRDLARPALPRGGPDLPSGTVGERR